MELKLDRKYTKETYTIGNLYIDGKFECNVLEDKDRGLLQTMPYNEIAKKKVWGQTAIPRGRYEVTFAPSSVFGKCDYAIDGKIPILLNVKCFSGIRMHAGNSSTDTEGCLLLGENKERGKVLNSRATCKRVFEKLYFVYKHGGRIWITIY